MGSASPTDLLWRLDEFPLSRWHTRLRAIIGGATLFDAFDAVMVSLTLPVLSRLWSLNAGQIGVLIAIGYGGQAIGAMAFGRLTERVGRVPALQIAITLFAVMSLVSATAATFEQLLIYRFIGGLGLGGEMPIGATYISEFAPREARGRFFLLYELLFSLGFVLASLAGAVILPRLGWRIFYAIGGLPLLLVPLIRAYCPESPRWLIAKGRLEKASSIIEAMEATQPEAQRALARARPFDAVPAVPTQPANFSMAQLFSGAYARRTIVVWLLWISAYGIVYGAVGWLPTILRNVYHLPLQTALNLTLLSNILSLGLNFACAMLVDKVGRGRWFLLGFALVFAEFTALGLLSKGGLGQFLILGLSALGVLSTLSFLLYLYTPEVYPTRIRATGVSVASFWMRIASIIAPLAVGWILPAAGISAVYLYFAAAAVIGLLACLIGGVVNASGRTLEEVSP